MPISIMKQSLCGEGTEGTIKKNFIQKAIDMLIRALKWIGDRLRQFGRWVKSLFNSNQTENINDIAADLLGSGSSSGSTSTSSNPESSKQGKGNNELNGVKLNTNKAAPVVVRVEIPSDPNSDPKAVPPNVVSMAFNPIQLKIDKAKRECEVWSWDEYYMQREKSDSLPQQKGPSYVHYFRAIAFLSYPDTREKVMGFVNSLFPSNVSSNSAIKDGGIYYKTIADDILNYKNSLESNGKNTGRQIEQGRTRKFSIDDIEKANAVLDKAIENITAAKEFIIKMNDKEVSVAYAMALDQLEQLIFSLQIGMNLLFNCANYQYTIDLRYKDQIHDFEGLAKFVSRCINANIPSKYIGYNTYLIAAPELKGDDPDHNENKPLWGQTRVVLFPTNNKNVVIKCALNKYGVKTNRDEYTISKHLKDVRPPVVAPVVKASSDNVCTQMIRTGKQAPYDPNVIGSVVSRLQSALAQKHLNVRIDDIHQGNVRELNGNWVAIDYGEYRT